MLPACSLTRFFVVFVTGTVLTQAHAMEIERRDSGANDAVASGNSEDPFAWLEDIRNPQTVAWVKSENRKTLSRLEADPRFAPNYKAALALYSESEHDSSPRFSQAMLYEGWVYQVWQDKSHPHGVWRRARVGSLRNPQIEWQELVDIDELSRLENKSWSLESRAQCYGSRCLLKLLDGGGTNASIREFDLESRTFVRDGFILPDCDQIAIWKNADALLLATDFGPGTRTATGNPLTVREWRRGQPLSEAREVFRGDVTDYYVRPVVFTSESGERAFIVARLRGQQPLWRLYDSGEAKPMTMPSHGPIAFYKGRWIIRLLRDWQLGGRTWKSGTLIAIADADVTQPTPDVEVVMDVGPRESILEGEVTKEGMLLTTTHNVRAQMWKVTFDGSHWNRLRLPLPENGKIELSLFQNTASEAFVSFEDLITPSSLYEIDVAKNRVTPLRDSAKQSGAPDFETEQLEAASKDGTRIPYFVVRRKGTKLNGKAPTLLWAYGSADHAQLPEYDPARQRLWLEKGGVYVLANIRGGDEVEASWRVEGSGRQRTYEDFISVAEDLIRRRITSPRYLGIRGHSNGGLLVGVALNWRPELYKAAVIENPALDQIDQRRRLGHAYSPGLGAWDNPADLEFLRRTSPYQNLVKHATFPMPLILTNSNDGMPPSYARKYAAKLAAFGNHCFFYESPEGGHSFGDTPEAKALHDALVYTYLASQLM